MLAHTYNQHLRRWSRKDQKLKVILGNIGSWGPDLSQNNNKIIKIENKPQTRSSSQRPFNLLSPVIKMVETWSKVMETGVLEGVSSTSD